MSINLRGKNPLMSNQGLSPLEAQLVKRNIGGGIPKFGGDNLSSPLPKLGSPIPRMKRLDMPHIKMPLQFKSSF